MRLEEPEVRGGAGGGRNKEDRRKDEAFEAAEDDIPRGT